ncbi:unnamed protein product [Sphacelaria rigidula]
MAFKAFFVLVALCMVALGSAFVAPSSFARHGKFSRELTLQMKAPSPAAAVPAAALAVATSVFAPIASRAADQSSSLVTQLPTELIADSGTATLAIVLGVFVPCAFLITVYFGTEQKKKGVEEGKAMK